MNRLYQDLEAVEGARFRDLNFLAEPLHLLDETQKQKQFFSHHTVETEAKSDFTGSCFNNVASLQRHIRSKKKKKHRYDSWVTWPSGSFSPGSRWRCRHWLQRRPRCARWSASPPVSDVPSGPSLWTDPPESDTDSTAVRFMDCLCFINDDGLWWMTAFLYVVIVDLYIVFGGNQIKSFSCYFTSVQ